MALRLADLDSILVLQLVTSLPSQVWRIAINRLFVRTV